MAAGVVVAVSAIKCKGEVCLHEEWTAEDVNDGADAEIRDLILCHA